jgi:hypothetical protein
VTALLRLRRALGRRGAAAALVVAAFLATRLLAIAATHLGARFMTPQKQAQWAWIPGRSDLHFLPPPPAFLAPLQRWDANFYVALAAGGYPPPQAGGAPNHHLAFFPLYPLAVRAAAHATFGNFFWAAFAVSNLSALLAALLVLRLGAIRRRGDGVRAAALFLASPGAHFFTYPYSEALFCLALALALWALLSQWFSLAALAGAAASATRSAGVAAAVALCAHAVTGLRGSARLRCLLAAGLSLAGIGAVMAWSASAQGDALAFVHIQGYHKRHLSLLGPIQAIFAFDCDPDYYLVTFAALWAAARMVRRAPPWASASAAFLLLLPMATGTLQAMIRYQAANVPLLCSAPLVIRRRWFWPMVWACAALMALEAFLFGKGIGHY